MPMKETRRKYFPLCLSVPISVFVCLTVCLSICLSFCLSVFPYIYLSAWLSVHLSVKSDGTRGVKLPTQPFYGKSWEDKISDIQNNTNSSKLVLVTDITVPRKLGTVISVTSTRLDLFVLFYMSEILPPLTSLKRLSKQLQTSL